MQNNDGTFPGFAASSPVFGEDGARTNRHYKYGDVELDTAAHLVRCGGVPVPLTPKETALLAVFLAAPGQAFTRAQLLAAVWQAKGELRTRTVDAHVRSLRKKLGPHHRIVTLYRQGYCWE